MEQLWAVSSCGNFKLCSFSISPGNVKKQIMKSSQEIQKKKIGLKLVNCKWSIFTYPMRDPSFSACAYVLNEWSLILHWFLNVIKYSVNLLQINSLSLPLWLVSWRDPNKTETAFHVFSRWMFWRCRSWLRCSSRN